MEVSQCMAHKASLKQDEYRERCASAPDLSKVFMQDDIFRPMTGVVGDERLRMAHARKQANTENLILQRLHSMRSELPDEVHKRFGEVSQETRHFAKHEETLMPNSGMFFGALRRGASGALGRQKPDVSRATVTAVRPQEKVKVPIPRARRHWRKLFATTKWIGVLHEARKRNKAQMALTAFLRRVGEWMRVKSAMTKFKKFMIKVQRTWREFAKRKHHHISVLEHQWQHIEDDFLSSYFTLYYKKMYATLKAKGILQTDGTSHAKAHGHIKDQMSNKSHWQQFRIPHKDRYLVLEQYHRMRLRQLVHAEDSILKTVNKAKGWQQDLDTFLRRLKGSGESETKQEPYHESEQEHAQRVSISQHQRAFWQCPQNTTLALIALVAKSLVDTHPFQDHPANNDVLGEDMGRSTDSKAKTRGGGKSRPKILALPPGIEYALRHPGGIRTEKTKDKRKSSKARRQTTPQSVDLTFDVADQEPQELSENLEHIFDNFTPRLQEFAEEEREGSEPDLSHTTETLDPNLRRPSLLRAAVETQGPGAHPE